MIEVSPRGNAIKVGVVGAFLCALLSATIPARCSAADDDPQFRALVTENLQMVLTSLEKCATLEANASDALKEALQAITAVPGNYDFVPQQTFDNVRNAAGGTLDIDQAGLEACFQARDIHARNVPGRRPTERPFSAVEQSLQRCVTALDEVGDNAAVLGILRTLTREPGAETFRDPKTLTALKKAAGQRIELSKPELEFCIEVFDAQLKQKLRIASSSPSTSPEPVGDCPYYCCPAGTFACFGTSPYPSCCPNNISYCSQTCFGFGQCSAWCVSSCFPGSATVLDASGRTKLMRDVSVGDRLQVIRPDGSLGYEDVYLLTHKDSTQASRYLRITLASGRELTLSPRHFVPMAQDPERPDWQARVVKGADEIKVGDVLWFHDGAGMQPARVAGVASEIELGAFNPLTLSGTIVVDGVVASAHSDWFLDGIVSAHAQDWIYQAMFAPVRVIYRVIGPEWTREISERWGVVDFAHNATQGRPEWAPAWIVAAVLLLIGGVLFLRRRRRVVTSSGA